MIEAASVSFLPSAKIYTYVVQALNMNCRINRGLTAPQAAFHLLPAERSAEQPFAVADGLRPGRCTMMFVELSESDCRHSAAEAQS